VFPRSSTTHSARGRARGVSLLWLAFWVALGGASGALPALGANFSLEGRAYRTAWSGYWWPMLVGSRGWHLYDERGPFTPLVKYGQDTGDFGPLAWEQRFKLTTDPNNDWWGHCNGWAAAAVLEPEPTQGVRTGAVVYNVGEIKGLLAACHQGDPLDFFSGRAHRDGADYRTDLRALDFHRALLFYLRDRGESLILNISEKPEIWNYPAYAFRMNGATDFRNPSVTQVTVTLAFADNNVQPHFVGTATFTTTYTYWVQGDPQSTNGATAADWTGNSVFIHPQFAWHPAYQRAHEPALGEPPNPIDYNRVRRLGEVAANRP
jgi:hypothetical protein